MNLNSLQPASGSVKSNSKRLGRGQGSGKGGTSTKGHKGAKSRSGYAKKIGFEGGQMPLQRRVPKYGFTNFNRVEYAPVNLDVLQALVDSGIVKDSITLDNFIENRIITKNDLVKILGRGKLSAKVNVVCHKCSDAAKSAIEAAGGTVTIL